MAISSSRRPGAETILLIRPYIFLSAERPSLTKVLIEEFDCSLPCQFRGRFVVPRGRIVMESVVYVFVRELLIRDAVSLQGALVSWPSSVHPRVQPGVVNEQWRLDFGS